MKIKEKVEETGGELTTVPNEKYQKFFAKFAEIDVLDVTQWKIAHVLGYFCRKYKEQYNLDYQFKFNHESPSKCYEVYRINLLSSKLSTKPQILKVYIDWVFQEKAKKSKRRFNSIAFIVDEETVNYYKMNVLLANKSSLHIDRSSLLPQEIKKFFAICGSFNTYGDIAFFAQAVKSGGLDNETVEKFNSALEAAKVVGFNSDVLVRIM